jgi:hypothetical protein
MDVEGASTSPGARFIQWPCNNGFNQQFRLEGTGGGYYRFRPRHSEQCMDVSGASQSPGASIIQWPCNYGFNQEFRIE